MNKSSLIVIIDPTDSDSYHYNYIHNYFFKKLKDLDYFLNKTYFITYQDLNDIRHQLNSLSDTLCFCTTSTTKHDDLIEILKPQFPKVNFIESKLFYQQVYSVLTQITQGQQLLGTYINADYLVYNFNTLIPDPQDVNLRFLTSKIDVNNLNKKLLHSINIIEKCLNTRSNNSQTCISFNGGKDCCVVLYLYFACALKLGHKFPLNVLYIKIKNSFPQMDYFIDEQMKNFYKSSLNYIIFTDTSKTLKECLCELKQTNDGIENILMGTRRSDGSYFKNMSEFAPTDKDWPEYVRVNPILDWTYSEIWYFILLLKLPYCSLYDGGYTSLDSSTNTVKNKALLKHDGTYLPAYMLENGELERESRIKYAKL